MISSRSYTDTWGNHRTPSKDFEQLKTKSQCATWIFMCGKTNLSLSYNPVLVHLLLTTKGTNDKYASVNGWSHSFLTQSNYTSPLTNPGSADTLLGTLFTFGSRSTNNISIAQLHLSKDCTLSHRLYCTLLFSQVWCMPQESRSLSTWYTQPTWYLRPSSQQACLEQFIWTLECILLQCESLAN